MKKENRGSHKQVETGCQETSGGSCVVSRFQSGRIVSISSMHSDILFLAAPLAYFPVLFLITYILNGLTVQHKLRPLYFLSAFFFYSFFVAG